MTWPVSHPPWKSQGLKKGTARAPGHLKAPEWAQCHFLHVLLVKAVHRPAQIVGVEKQASVPDRKKYNIPLQRGMNTKR